MTRFFSFFEGAGSGGLGLITSGCGGGGGGAGSTTGAGAAGTGRVAGHEQPPIQTIAISTHIGKIIFLLINITPPLFKMGAAYLENRNLNSFVNIFFNLLLKNLCKIISNSLEAETE